jgi:hypothetical protein
VTPAQVIVPWPLCLRLAALLWGAALCWGLALSAVTLVAWVAGAGHG